MAEKLDTKRSLNVNQRVNAQWIRLSATLTKSPAEQANMADTEAKSSASLGANEPPTPSPSTASPLPDAPLKVTYVQPLSMPSSVYRAVANLNRGFEQGVHNLKALQEFNYFPEENLIAWGNILSRLQAEASLWLLDVLHNRLMNNALFYDRLCWTRERRLEDPDDVLIQAEQRKRELAAEQQRQEHESED